MWLLSERTTGMWNCSGVIWGQSCCNFCRDNYIGILNKKKKKIRKGFLEGPQWTPSKELKVARNGNHLVQNEACRVWTVQYDGDSKIPQKRDVKQKNTGNSKVRDQHEQQHEELNMLQQPAQATAMLSKWEEMEKICNRLQPFSRVW